MDLELSLKTKMIKFYLSTIFVGYVLSVLMMVSFTYFQKNTISKSLINSIRNEMLLGSYRAVKVSLINISKTGNFPQIVAFDQDGSRILEVSSVFSKTIFFVPMTLKSLVSLDETSKLQIKVLFLFNAFEFFPVLNFFWLIALLVIAPFAVKHFKNLEQQYEEKMRRSNFENAGRIAKQVAHDIRSPLSAIRVFSSKAEWHDESYKNSFKMAMEQINSITNDLLLFDKKTATRREKTDGGEVSELYKKRQNESKLDLEVLVIKIRALLDQKNREFDLKNMAIRTQVHLEGSLKGFILVKESDLLRSLSNILNNSYEAIDAGGFVSVSASIDQSRFVLEIRDNGVGVAEADISKIFQEGFSKGKSFGSGLGLSYARKIVQEVGGEIRFFSKQGLGSTVQMSLPHFCELP